MVTEFRKQVPRDVEKEAVVVEMHEAGMSFNEIGRRLYITGQRAGAIYKRWERENVAPWTE